MDALTLPLDYSAIERILPHRYPFLLVDRITELEPDKRIVGIKDATGNIERGSELVRRAPKGFGIYSGDDGTGLALMLMGCHGVISVTANVAPAAMRQMCDAALKGDAEKARAILSAEALRFAGGKGYLRSGSQGYRVGPETPMKRSTRSI